MTAALGALDTNRHPGPSRPGPCTTVRRGQPPWRSGNPCTAAGRLRAQHGRWWLLSYEVVNWAMYKAPSVRTAAGKRDSTARQVLVVLAEKAHDDGTESYPSVETIALATDLEVRTVQRALRRLEEAKLIERTTKRWSGTQTWRLNLSLTRPPSDEDELRAKVETRRAASTERVRKHRAQGSAGEVSGAPVTHSDCVAGAESDGGVTQSECVTGEASSAPVTHFDGVRNALRVRSVTHSTPPEPPLGTILDPSPGGRRAAPQTPAQLHPVADVRSGLISDLEFVDPLTTRALEALPPGIATIVGTERLAEYDRMHDEPPRRPRTRKQRLRDQRGSPKFGRSA